MILRRITQHVKDQNWFAVALDFLIVVVGVVIGIQVANWNTAQAHRRAYETALARFGAEIDANLADLRGIEERSLERIATVRMGFDTLLNCNDSPEGRRIVEAGIARSIGAYGVGIRMTSLRELTESPSLLAQQSEPERKILNDTRLRVDFLLSEAKYFEDLPFETRIELSPMLAIGRRELLVWGQYSKDPSLAPNVYGLVMAAPLDVACKDEALLKAFFAWEYWQSGISDIARALQETLVDIQEGLSL